MPRIWNISAIGNMFDAGRPCILAIPDHLVFEVFDNSVDEILAGFATEIAVAVGSDGSVAIEDNGRGIPVEDHPELKKSTLECVMTVLKFGGKFSKKAYGTSGGLHGVGVTVVNFLSEQCEVAVARNGSLWRQKYRHGLADAPVEQIGSTCKQGTKTVFKPDPEIFETVEFQDAIIRQRLQETAFLNPGIRIVYKFQENKEEIFEYKNGLCDYLTELRKNSEPIHEDPICLKGQRNDVRMEIALQYTNRSEEDLRSFANNIRTANGGFHVSGFKAGLTKTLGAYARKRNLIKNIVPNGDDYREGLIAIISVCCPDPHFEGQTKGRLLNIELDGIVQSLFSEAFAVYLEEHPKSGEKIIERALLAAKARMAAEAARRSTIAEKSIGIRGKLRDCSSRDPIRREIFLVEGDSAGGSAEGGRDRTFQAILPLRGKVINTYKATDQKVLSNQEIQSIISAVGAGYGAKMNPEKCRYGKIIIMTDADVDGSHIRTLLLAFFYRQMYDLVKTGHLYIAQPPLFRVKKKGSRSPARYVQTEEEMKEELLIQGVDGVRFYSDKERIFSGDELLDLCRIIGRLQEHIILLEKRGIDAMGYLTRPEEEYIGEFRKIPDLRRELCDFGFEMADLFPQIRIGRDGSRFSLERGETAVPVNDLFELLASIRKYGEQGQIITRFKGLGEMDPEELRETTLDPGKRTLVQITLEDAESANELFNILMSDQVGPRREFIEHHSQEVQYLDI
ncbi:MAG: toprim domain-containing protein [Planctomycetia bacterium]|nr:toprim domain-containing protein [Planctomycetia bacterium]